MTCALKRSLWGLLVGSSLEKGQEWKQGTQVEGGYFSRLGESCGGLIKVEAVEMERKDDLREAAYDVFGSRLTSVITKGHFPETPL